MLVKGNHKIIILFLLLGASVAANAQQDSILLPLSYSLRDSVKLPEIVKFFLVVTHKTSTIAPVHPLPTGTIGADYYTRQWGIFCESEWRIEKKTGIPLRFRLGSLEYVDRLEGKK